MTRPFTPKIVTANDLRNGRVVYLTSDDRWADEFTEAEILTDEADAEMRLVFALGQSRAVVGPYLADVVRTPEGAAPKHFRETFRATGPSFEGVA